MSLPKDKAWFRAKRYGYGWGLPRRWQGWLVLCIYVAFLVLAAGLFAGTRPPRFVICAVVLSAVLIAICAWKGEPPKWRWGRSGDDDVIDE
jgi:uncharacterized membrane protein YhaH (DUF805 family)